ncbi:hypothetical protein NKJ50_33740, partial [Mesorhizobium sp. M0115]|uniref:hypothetical protein n=1 Tax=Mesorhizobium sp. M0115 TaxID=2956883 RepID=UPI00333CE2BF
MGEAISLRVLNLPNQGSQGRETDLRRLALLTPSYGGPSADREEKRVTCGTVREKVQEHLDHNDPNQRGLLD